MKPSFRLACLLFFAGFLAFPDRAFSQTNPDTFTVVTCHHFWKTGAPVPGMINYFYPPGTGLPFEVTETDGCTEYTFAPGVFNASDLCPTGYRNSDAANGVTIADLLRMWSYILGILPIEPTLVQLAGDVYPTNTITSKDEGETIRMILGVYSEWPNNNSWKSIYSGLQLNSATNVFAGWSCTYPFDLTVPVNTIDQIVYKIGDVDGDANPTGAYVVPQNLPFATISIPDWTIQAGDTVEVPVYMDIDGPIFGFQTGFNLDHNLGNFIGLSDGIISPYILQTAIFQDALTFLKVSIDPQIVPVAGLPMFYIKIKANQTFQIKDALTINTDIMPALWVDTDYMVHPFETSITTTRLLPEPSAGVRVLPPSPNPFHDFTSIRAKLDEPAETRLEVFDIQGRILWTNEFYLNAGANSIDIPGAAMATGSLAFYRLYTSDWMVSGKLVRQ